MIDYTVDSTDHIAVISFNMQGYPANVINEASMLAFSEALERAIQEDVRGIIITSARKEFLVGADLEMVMRLQTAEEVFEKVQELHKILRRLETCGKPVAAALNGNALGGGLELALACHHRVAVSDGSIQIGLPEVQLGLLPGGGGTQRLPRLIGLQNSLSYILEAKRLNPHEAAAAKIIDAQVDNPAHLIDAARHWIVNGGRKTQPWDEKGYKVPGGEVLSTVGTQVMPAAISLLRKNSYGNYPGAFYALSAIYEGLQLPIDRALKVEARYFTKAAMSKEARNMIRTLFFHVNEANKGIARPTNIPPADIKKVGVLGAGMMGAGIAYVSALNGMYAVLKDTTQEAAEKGKAYSTDLMRKKVNRAQMKADEMDTLLSHIIPTTEVNGMQNADIVIEAVYEDRALKAQVTQETEAVLSEKAIFASNTSTLPISGLAEASVRPENFIGLHYFSPVDKMQLVEVIVGEKTSDYALAVSLDYVKKIKKTPIVVRDSRGFFTSRVFATYVKEGLAILSEGVLPALIENAGREAGMPIGPLALADEVSISLLYHIVKQTEQDLGITINDPAAQIGRLFIEQLDRPGKKAGKGFYDYPKDAKKHLWEGLVAHFIPASTQPDIAILKKRILNIQAVEAARCLDEKVIARPQDADVGSIFGWGFAPYTGGVLSYIDYIGADVFVRECDEFTQKLGERFAVPEFIRTMAQNKQKFYN